MKIELDPDLEQKITDVLGKALHEEARMARLDPYIYAARIDLVPYVSGGKKSYKLHCSRRLLDRPASSENEIPD